MQKIKTLKIMELTLNGFRCHKDNIVIPADDMTLISGCNGKGKSSIAHAIAYALYGTDAFGTLDIDRILNENSDTVSVKIKFADETATAHEFGRVRCGDRTELTFDGYKIRQKDIDAMFGDKDTFLSLFNPSYFAEVMGSKARDFLELRLPVIKPEAVLAKMTESERLVLGLGKADLSVPEVTIKNTRSDIRRLDEDNAFIGGQIAELQKSDSEKSARITAIETETERLGKVIKALRDKQFSGIDVAGLNTEKCMLDDKLSGSGESTAADELKALQAALYEVESREYHSKFTEPMSKVEAELNAMAVSYNGLQGRLNSMQIGDKCPTCLTQITAENVGGIKAELQSQIESLMADGRAQRLKLNELKELDSKAKAVFYEFAQADIAKVKGWITEFQSRNPDNKSELYRRLNEIDDVLKRGNLSEAEHAELTRSDVALSRLVTEHNALQNTDYAKRIANLQSKQSENESRKVTADELISALQEYVAKRSELALAGLKTTDVSIKLFEVVRTTGEVKPCFKFLYGGREYPTLSLSEKIKAGLEITAMLRELIGVDFPVFIDNSESIGDYNTALLPTQTLFMRFVKGAEFGVKTRSISTMPKITEVKTQQSEEAA